MKYIKKVSVLSAAMLAMIFFSACEALEGSEKEAEKFIDIEFGSYGLYAVTNHNNLYVYEYDHTIDTYNLRLLLEDGDFDDFYVPYSRDEELIWLVKDGKIENIGEVSEYSQERYNGFTDINNVKSISKNAIITYDDEVKYFHENEWHNTNIKAQKIFDTTYYAVILDKENTVWSCDFADGELVKEAEGVIDFDSYPANKLHRNDAIWYIDTDNTLHAKQPEITNFHSREISLPDVTIDINKVYAESDTVLVQLSDGGYYYDSGITSKFIDIVGIDADVDMYQYAILDNEGAIHFEIDAVQLIANTDPIKAYSAKITLEK